MFDYDVVIAGSGPAGLATAIACRLQGLSVLVLEPRRGSLDKACGEGVLPRGAQILGAWGVRFDACGSSHDPPRVLRGIRFVDAGRTVDADFEAGLGYGVRRLTLSLALQQRAAALGAEWCWGRGLGSVELGNTARGECDTACVVQLRGAARPESVRARFVVGADGLHSRVRALVNPSLRGRRGGKRPLAAQARFGVRQHFALAPWSDRVEVHYFAQGEAYVTPLGQQLVNVAVLGPRALSIPHAVQRLPELRARLAGVSPLGRRRGAGPLHQPVPRQARGRIALVGDAAGYLDAATGEGLSLGFVAAGTLAEALACGSLGGYSRAYRALTRNYRVMTQLMLQLSASPRLRAVVLQLLERRPDVASGLLSVSEGTRPLAWLGSGLFRALCRPQRTARGLVAHAASGRDRRAS